MRPVKCAEMKNYIKEKKVVTSIMDKMQYVGLNLTVAKNKRTDILII